MLNTSSRIIPEGIKTFNFYKSCFLIERIHNHYKEMEIIKDQLISKLIEQYIQVIDYVNQYYEVSLFELYWSILNTKV